MLPKIENYSGVMVVSSRNVAEDFEKRHSDVLEKIEELIKTENSALIGKYFIPSSYKAGTGKDYKEYLLTRDGFSLLVMGFTGERALQWKIKYIEAFNQMENTIKKVLPNNYKEALQQLIASEEEKEKLQLTIKENEPKVIFADAVSSAHTSILVGDLAKILNQNGIKIGQNRLFEYLRNNNYLTKYGERKNMPTQKSMELGLFEIKERTILNPDGSNRLTRTTKVTGKGQQYFINKFLKGELR